MRRDQGQAIVYFAAVLVPALLGMMALALDGSMLFMTRTQMQVAADMASVAGARLAGLGESSAQVDAEVHSVASANGADSVTWSYTADGNGVHVAAGRTNASFLVQILGLSGFAVNAPAEASFKALTGADNLLPMAISCSTTFVYGTAYDIWDKAKDAPGAFGWLSWDGSSSEPTLEANIRDTTRSGIRRVGDWVSAGPGVKASSGVRSALDTQINKSVTVVLQDQVTGNGSNTQYHICGFAQFTLTDYDFQGKNKYVRGVFTRAVRSGELHGASAIDGGVYGITLSK